MSVLGLDVTDTPVLALMVSILTVVTSAVGLLVSFNMARMQTVAPIRQKWVDELRTLLSEYISECEELGKH